MSGYAFLDLFESIGDDHFHYRFHIIEEYGKLDGLVGITGTLNVGAVMEGLQRWYFRHQSEAAFPYHIPTVFVHFVQHT